MCECSECGREIPDDEPCGDDMGSAVCVDCGIPADRSPDQWRRVLALDEIERGRRKHGDSVYLRQARECLGTGDFFNAYRGMYLHYDANDDYAGTSFCGMMIMEFMPD